jgi:hypothetical protein
MGFFSLCLRDELTNSQHLRTSLYIIHYTLVIIIITVQRFIWIKCKAHLLYMTNNTRCNHRKTNQAEIFQESGEYYLHYWQERTFPNV